MSQQGKTKPTAKIVTLHINAINITDILLVKYAIYDNRTSIYTNKSFSEDQMLQIRCPREKEKKLSYDLSAKNF